MIARLAWTVLLAAAVNQAVAADKIQDVWITVDGCVDTSSLPAMVRSLVASRMTNDRKAVAILRYMHGTVFYYDYYPGEPFATDPIRFLNCYGWSLCGKHNNALLSVCRAAGFDGRMVAMNNHSSCEVFYDGKWHWIDASRGDFQRLPDGRVASLAEIKTVLPERFRRITRGVCRPGRRGAGPVALHRMGLTLRNGERVTWHNGHGDVFWFPGQRRERFLAKPFGTGQWHYEADFTGVDGRTDLRWHHHLIARPGKGLTPVGENAHGVLAVESPYLFARATLRLAARGNVAVAVSIDGGLTWRRIKQGANGTFDLTGAVAGYFEILLRLSLGAGSKIRRAVFDGVFHHNRLALPVLRRGRNVVRVRSKPDPRARSPIGLAFSARWTQDGKPQYVRRGIAASPAAFVLNIGGHGQPRLRELAIGRGLDGVSPQQVVRTTDVPATPPAPDPTVTDGPVVLPAPLPAALPASRPDGTTYTWIRGISTLVAPTTDTPPVIDGRLDDPAWRRASSAAHWAGARGTVPARQPSAVYLLRDAKHIYVGLYAAEPRMAELKAAVRHDDGRVYVDDDFELFVSPDPAKGVYQLAFNASGTCYDARNRAAAWNGEWHVATHRYADGWTAEVILPVAAFAGGAAATEWRFNACRSRTAKGETPGEATAWCCPFGSFHASRNFGRLLRADSPVALADGTLRNLTGKERRVVCAVWVNVPGGRQIRRAITLPAGASVRVEAIPTLARALKPGHHLVEIRAAAEGGPELIEQFRLTVRAAKGDAR